jgi:hypothetical protein
MLFVRILKEKKVYIFMFILGLMLGCCPTNAFALPVASSAKIVSAAYRADLEKVSSFLQKDVVAQRLSQLGLSAEEIKASLSNVDEHQMQQFAQKVESIDKAGSGAGIAIGILAVLLIFIIFLYATDRKVKLHNPVSLEKNE